MLPTHSCLARSSRVTPPRCPRPKRRIVGFRMPRSYSQELRMGVAEGWPGRDGASRGVRTAQIRSGAGAAPRNRHPPRYCQSSRYRQVSGGGDAYLLQNDLEMTVKLSPDTPTVEARIMRVGVRVIVSLLSVALTGVCFWQLIVQNVHNAHNGNRSKESCQGVTCSKPQPLNLQSMTACFREDWPGCRGSITAAWPFRMR